MNRKILFAAFASSLIILLTGVYPTYGQYSYYPTTPVTPSPDFALASSPSSLTIQEGTSGSSTVTVTSQAGFNSGVALSVSGNPIGTTTSFSPNMVTPMSGGQAISTLTIDVGSSTTAGRYTLIITGSSGSQSHRTTVTIVVTAPPENIAPSQAPEKSQEEDRTTEEEETYASGMSADGSVHVDIESSVAKAGEAMSITVTFTDANGNKIQHINYDIAAMQDGIQVLSQSGAHEHKGEGMHTTDALASDSSVDIQVTILGIGLPGEEATWTGPKGDVVSLQVVPEFGTIAALVFAISIVSIIVVTAKTRVIAKL